MRQNYLLKCIFINNIIQIVLIRMGFDYVINALTIKIILFNKRK